MSFNQYRTNPGQAVSSFKGRTDTPKAWPSTAVSTWTNGGLFGGGSLKSFFMEMGAAANAGDYASFQFEHIATNVHDGKTYVAGRWDNYAGAGFNNDYAPVIGQLKTDGSTEFEWLTICWYNSTSFTPQQYGMVSFQAGSSDVFFANPYSLAGANSATWSRFSDAGALLNTANSQLNTAQNRNRVAIIPAAQSTAPNYVHVPGCLQWNGFQVHCWSDWTSKTANSSAPELNYPRANVNSYVSWQQHVESGTNGAHYYEGNQYGSPGNRIGYVFTLGKTQNITYLWRREQGNNSNVNFKKIVGWSSNGTVTAYGNGDNNMGLVLGNYQNKVLKTTSYAGDVAWARKLNGSALTVSTVYGPHMDVDGNVYITGEWQPTGNGVAKAFVTKLDSSGNALWVREVGLTVSGANKPLQGKSITTSLDGTKVYVTFAASYLEYSGSASTNFPRVLLLCMNADGSDSGSFLIDNSSGFGAGTANYYNIAAGNMTIQTDSISMNPSALGWGAPNNGDQGAGSINNTARVTATPFSANGNKPITPSVDIT